VNKSNNTLKCQDKQQQTLATEVISKLSLPVCLEETATTHGALIRRRVIKSGKDLLLSLLMYAISGMSLRLLAASTTAMGIADMSDQAWQKKLYYVVLGLQIYCNQLCLNYRRKPTPPSVAARLS